MRYVLLAYEPATAGELSDEGWAAQVADTVALEAGLGIELLAREVLADVDTATTVRVRGGEVAVTDGPFAETAEVLGGFLLVEAADLDAAIAIARRWPAARSGSVEVRPVSA
jgi:hypothetical protein